MALPLLLRVLQSIILCSCFLLLQCRVTYGKPQAAYYYSNPTEPETCIPPEFCSRRLDNCCGQQTCVKFKELPNPKMGVEKVKRLMQKLSLDNDLGVCSGENIYRKKRQVPPVPVTTPAPSPPEESSTEEPANLLNLLL